MAVLSKGSVVISLHALLAYISKLLASGWISQVVLEGGRARHVEVHLFTWENHSHPPPPLTYLVLPSGQSSEPVVHLLCRGAHPHRLRVVTVCGFLLTRALLGHRGQNPAICEHTVQRRARAPTHAPPSTKKRERIFSKQDPLSPLKRDPLSNAK